MLENKKNADKKVDEQKSAKSAYVARIRAADSAFKSRSYDTARFEYTQALREYPDDRYVQAQLKKIDNILREDSYKSYINIGKDAMSNQLFDNAEMAFKEALKIRPNDPVAKKELAKLVPAKASLLKKQKDELLLIERQTKYNDTVSLADNMFEAGMYADARKIYRKADKLKPGQSHVVNRISQIDSIMSIHQKVLSEFKQDSINTVVYNNEIQKGDRAFERKEYNKAKSAFKMAQSIRPHEKYPAERISVIDVLLIQHEEDRKAEAARKLEQETKNKQYSFAIKQGSTAMSKNEYQVAEAFYLKARELKPAEKLPVTQLEIISRKLEEKRNNEKYETYIHLADSLAFIVKDYNASLRWYDSAIILKPRETYPKKQVIAINDVLLQRESNAMKQKAARERTEKYDAAFSAYKRAEDARIQGKYDLAYTAYSEFLLNIDTVSINEYSSTQAHHIKQAKDYLVRLERFKPKPQVDTIRSVDNNDKRRRKKRT